MTWPLDVFGDWLAEIPLISAELNGSMDHLKKIANSWSIDDMKRSEPLRAIGHPGIWKLNHGTGSE